MVEATCLSVCLWWFDANGLFNSLCRFNVHKNSCFRVGLFFSLEGTCCLTAICPVIKICNVNLLTDVTAVRLEPCILCLCFSKSLRGSALSQLQYSLSHPDCMGGLSGLLGNPDHRKENPVV